MYVFCNCNVIIVINKKKGKKKRNQKNSRNYTLQVPILFGYEKMIYYTPKLLRKNSHDHRLDRQYNLHVRNAAGLKAVLEFIPVWRFQKRRKQKLDLKNYK